LAEVSRSQTVVIARAAERVDDVLTMPRSLDGSTPDAVGGLLSSAKN
jgi:hypothetical protein